MPVSNFTLTSTTGANSGTLLANAAMTKISLKIVQLAIFWLRYMELCDYKEDLGSNNSKTIRFNKFADFDLPTSALSEGVDPAGSTLSSDYVEAVVEQWGDVVAVSDIAELTVKHPIMEVIQTRLSRQAGKTIDREIQLVLDGGTSIRYAGGAAGRASLTTSSIFSKDDVNYMVAKLQLNGAEPMDGQNYVAVVTPGVEKSLLTFDNFILASAFAKASNSALYTGEIGYYLGCRFIVTNFSSIFSNNTTVSMGSITAASSGAADGSLGTTTTYYYKIVAKDKHTNFVKVVFAEASLATSGSDTSLNLTMPASTDYVYDIYFGSASGATYLSSSNNAAAAVVKVKVVPTTTAAPVTPATNVYINKVRMFGKGAYAVTTLQNLQFFATPAGSYPGAVLRLMRFVGWKVAFKACILQNDFMIQCECHSGVY